MSGKNNDKEHEQYSMFDTEFLTLEEASPVKNAKVGKQRKGSELDVEALHISDSQPRRYINEERLEELCLSIRKHGVLQPVIVQVDADGSNLLVAGQRRLLAARKAGLKKIPVVFTDGDPAEIALIENLQRSDLTAIEEAEAISSLKEKNGYTLDDVSAIMGKSKTTVSETISLTKLPDTIKEECRRDPQMAKSILVEIARQPTADEMITAYDGYKNGKLPRAQLRKINRPGSTGKKRIGVGFVKSFAQRIVTVDVDILKNKQREQMKNNLEELHTKIGDLIVKLSS